MEFFLEVLFDLILEGSIEIGTSRKVPLVFRILALSLLVVVYGAFVVFLAVRKNIENGEIANEKNTRNRRNGFCQ